MTDELNRLRQDYGPAFLAYLTYRDEAGLRAAYELGRAAMRNAVGLLELVRVHHDIALEPIRTARSVEEAQDLACAAAAFLVEALAAFEMTQRGFMAAGEREDSGGGGI